MQRRFHLRPSYLLATGLLAAHFVVIASLLIQGFPLWVRATTAVLLSLNCVYVIWRVALLRAPQSCVALGLDGGSVELELRNGQVISAELVFDSVVTPWLTVLTLVQKGKVVPRRLLILPDSLSAESFRVLRVELRWADAG